MRNDIWKYVLVAVLVGFAGWRFYSTRDNSMDEVPLIYFYDMSAGELFEAPQDSIPPIQGIDNTEADGVRAIVIENNQPENDRDTKLIVYLEKFSPQMKMDIDKSRLASESGDIYERKIPRSESKKHTLVQKFGENTWHPMDSKAGLAIVSLLQNEGSNGQLPVIINP